MLSLDIVLPMEVASRNIFANLDFKFWMKIRKFNKRLRTWGKKIGQKKVADSVIPPPHTSHRPQKRVGGSRKKLNMFAEKLFWLPCFCSAVLKSSIVYVFLELRARPVATRGLEWLLS